MSEIGCHGKGAFFQEPAARIVIDIGGQDFKVIKLGAGGRVLNFVMNEKHAADWQVPTVVAAQPHRHGG